MSQAVIAATCMIIIGVAAIHEFGALNGTAILCAIYLLAPYDSRGQ